MRVDDATPVGRRKAAIPASALPVLAVAALLGVGGFYLSRPTPWEAIVTVPAEKRNGWIRSEPSQSGPPLGLLPNGIQVQVLDRRTSDKTWLKVRAPLNGTTVEGWMHREILTPVP